MICCKNINLLVMFSVFCLISVSGCQKKDSVGRPLLFFNAHHYDEYKRIPLRYPFEINQWVDIVRFSSWDFYDKPFNDPINTNSWLALINIQRFAYTDSCLYGEYDTGWVTPTGITNYFVIYYANTNLLRFANKIDFIKECALFGGDFKNLRYFDEQWETYWQRHKKGGR